MEYFMDMKDLLCVELEEYETQMQMKGKVAAGDLEAVHKLSDIIKNILKINLLESEVEEISGGSSYEGGGSSYARGRGRNARRDSMGRYASRAGGSSYDGGYSEDVGYSRRGSSRRGGSSYEGGQGGNMGGSSYRRGGNSYRGGSSYEGGYSYEGAKDYMMDKIEEMMQEAENGKQREALQKCMQALERA